MTTHQSESPGSLLYTALAKIPGVTLCPTCQTYRYPHACEGMSASLPLAELPLAWVDADMREDQVSHAPTVDVEVISCTDTSPSALDVEASAQPACPHGWTATPGKRGDYCRPCRRAPHAGALKPKRA
jgi:hypothetical protein